jgi:hypothetical protein
MPQPAQPAPRPAAQPDQKARNISSHTLEEGEVHKIAAELKQQLDTPGSDKPAEEALPKLKKRPKPKTEDSVSLEAGQDDTIFIDRDGTFRPAGPGSAS